VGKGKGEVFCPGILSRISRDFLKLAKSFLKKFGNFGKSKSSYHTL